MSMSPSYMGMASAKALRVANMFLCESMTPLGTPVEPDVYIMIAVSMGDGCTGSENEEITLFNIFFLPIET